MRLLHSSVAQREAAAKAAFRLFDAFLVRDGRDMELAGHPSRRRERS